MSAFCSAIAPNGALLMLQRGDGQGKPPYLDAGVGGLRYQRDTKLLCYDCRGSVRWG